MLQHPLLVQASVGILAIAFLWLGIFLFVRSEDSKIKLLLRIIPIILWLGTIAGAGYFFYNVVTHWTFFTIPKIILLLAVGVVVAFYCSGYKDPENSELGVFGGAVAIVVCAFIVIPMVSYFINDRKETDAHWAEIQAQLAAQAAYNANIKVVAEPKYREERITLLSATDGSKIEGSVSGDMRGALLGTFFVAHGSITGNINGEIKQTDVYKFYYYANTEIGEIRLATLNADSTPIFFTQDGETPHLLKKIWTRYSLNYNDEPPTECNPSDTVEYELHVPKGSIVEEFNLR